MSVHELTAAEIMSTKVVPISKDMPLSEAFKMFHKYQVSAFPVVDADAKYVGVISQTDLIPMLKPINDLQDASLAGRGAMATTTSEKVTFPPYRFLLQGKVEEVMTPSSFVFHQKVPVREIANMMKRLKIHRVYITGNDFQLLGVISTLDIVRLLAQRKFEPRPHRIGNVPYDKVLIQDVMQANITSVKHNMLIKDVIDLFVDTHFSGMPVLSAQDSLVGVISKGDMIRGLNYKKEDPVTLDTRVSHLMSQPGIYLSKKTFLTEAVKMMVDRGIHRLIVASERNQLDGVLSASDLINLLV